jgi:hypothetical protein
LSEQLDTLPNPPAPRLADAGIKNLSMARLDETTLELIRKAAEGSEAEIDKELIVRTAEELQVVAEKQGAQTALERCRSLMEDNPGNLWLLHVLAADFCLQQKDYKGYDTHLEQLVGYAKPDELVVALWQNLLHLFYVRTKDCAALLQRLDVFSKTYPHARDAVGALYVQCHLHRQEWEAAHHALRRFAKITTQLGGEPLVVKFWPILLVRLKKWNERAEVLRFTKRFAQRHPSTECEELAKEYVLEARDAWASGAQRETEFLLEIASILAPDGSETSRVVRKFHDELDDYHEVIRLIRDDRVSLAAKAQLARWYSEGIETPAELARLNVLWDRMAAMTPEGADMLERDLARIRGSYPRLYRQFGERLAAWIQERQAAGD